MILDESGFSQGLNSSKKLQGFDVEVDRTGQKAADLLGAYGRRW